MAAWVEAWNEGDPEVRRERLASAVAADCVFVGPTGTATGRDALHAAIAEAREFLPGATVVRDGPVREEGGELRFSWEVRSAEGGRVLAGVDRIEMDGTGRLRRVVVLPATSA